MPIRLGNEFDIGCEKKRSPGWFQGFMPEEARVSFRWQNVKNNGGMSPHTHTHVIEDLMHFFTRDRARSACTCLVILNITLKTYIPQVPRERLLCIFCSVSLNYKHMPALNVYRLCHCQCWRQNTALSEKRTWAMEYLGERDRQMNASPLRSCRNSILSQQCWASVFLLRLRFQIVAWKILTN